MCRHRILLKVLFLSVLIGAIVGCERRETADVSPFDQEPSDFVLLIAVDGDYVTDKPKAYELVTRAIDKYFHDRIGGHDQVIISQLSGNKEPLLWQGTPQHLRQEFPSQESFRSFLASHCDKGSRINDGIAESLDYVMRTNSVADGKAKTVAMILSDMIDDQPPSKRSDERLMKALIRYAKRGGIGFYFVNQKRMADIEEKMERAGFRFRTLESDIHGRPPLPNFE